MFGKLTKTLALAALIGLGSIVATTGQASAGKVDFWIGFGPNHGPFFGPGFHSRSHHGICKPRRAVGKARSMGVRKARLVRRNLNRVGVKGRRHGHPVRVVFANRRHCPVIALR